MFEDVNEDPTKLTSFQPLAPIASTGEFSLSKFFSSLRRKGKGAALPRVKDPVVPVEQSNQQTNQNEVSSLEAGNTAAAKSNIQKESNISSWMTESAASHTKLFGSKEKVPEINLIKSTTTQSPRSHRWRYRNVRTILRRLSALTIDRRWHQTTGDFKHNFKQYWMPDEHCKECYECNEKFNTFRRRHHCRVCGQIFCSKCCNREVPGKSMGFSGDIRVCNYCHKLVQAYTNDDFDKNMEALNEDMRACDTGYNYDFSGSTNSQSSISKSSLNVDDHGYGRLKKSPSGSNMSSISNQERCPTPVRSLFDVFGVTPIEANNIKQDYLRDLWHQITDPRKGLELQSLRYRLKTHDNCLVGNELVDWLIAHNKVNTRLEAISAGQALLDNRWIEYVHPTEEPVFRDEYVLYQPTKTGIAETAMWMELVTPFPPEDSDESNNEKCSDSGNVDIQDDDVEAPYWFRQMSSANIINYENKITTSRSQQKKLSADRRLDLDQVLDTEKEESKTDLSLQMKLDSQLQHDEAKTNAKEDPGNKISFITRAPPLPLDSYVCVERHPPNVKKKTVKATNSLSTMSEDVLHGVIFPRPTVEAPVVDGLVDETNKDETTERLAKDRMSVAAHHHINALSEQLLKQENLLPSWKDIILPFVLKVSEKVIPDVSKDDDIDIRRYAWITKVPGGFKADSHFISGVVFNKNIAHKRMADNFTQPKILMMSCAVEYQRVENKMSSLDPLVLQEQAFLQNFVKRVLALKPNLFLVEKSVARVAQDMLLAGGITLVHNIKPKIMENIARCTGAEILQTMEQVNRPKLGTCQNFKLQKYKLQNGNIKTLMYFEGCAPELGCSIILRGGNEKTLLKTKRVLKFLIYVAYHLKLESKFLLDEFAMPPQLDLLSSHGKLYEDLAENVDELTLLNETPAKIMKDANFDTESSKFQHALNNIYLSSSPFCSYPVPYLLTEQGKVCPTRHFIAEKIYWSRYLDGSVTEPSKLPQDDLEWVENEETNNPDIVFKEPHPFTDPTKLVECIYDSDKKVAMLNDFRARGGCIDLKMYQEYEKNQRKKVLGRYYDYIEKEKENEDINKEGIEIAPPEGLIFESTVDSHDPKHDCFDAYNHEKIAVLFSSYSSESHNAPKPCISPWAVFMEFYRRNDITLGGFLERYCFRPSYICPSHNCDVPMVSHVRYFAHGSGSLYIHMRILENPIPGFDRTILTWSWCKICKQATPVVPLSFEALAMSFAKYLEIRFYASGYTRSVDAGLCNHSLHHDYFQYFSFANMVASFKYRAINLYEVIIPPAKILIGKQRDPKLLLDEVGEIFEKVDNVMVQVQEKICSLQSVDPNQANTARSAYLNDLLKDLQKEKNNMKDCMNVIQAKTEVLITAKEISESEETSSVGTSSQKSINQSTQHESLKSISTSTISSSEDKLDQSGVDGAEGTDDQAQIIQTQNSQTKTSKQARKHSNQSQKIIPPPVKITDTEVNVLMVDIGNKVFHLKKSICLLVENWNQKLQEFVVQDKKREKISSVPQSASPVKPTSNVPIVDDVIDPVLDGSIDMGPARPKTVTHMHPEPVSEVFLDGGKILRQTYFGTTPSVSPLQSDANSESVSKSMEDSSNMNMSTETTVASPYTLIKSPTFTVGPTPTDSTPTNGSEITSSAKTSEKKEESEDKSEAPLNKSSDMNELRAVLDSSPVDNWLQSDRERSSTIVNRFKFLSDNDNFSDSEQSLKVECDSENDLDISDCQSCDNEFEENNLPESEVQSEVEIAEESLETSRPQSADDEEGIKIGESASDFQSSNNLKVPRRRSRKSPLSYTEFPKIRDEEIEKVEYLTPKEVKAMQSARRQKTEWQRKQQERLTPTKSIDGGRTSPLPIKENHFKKAAIVRTSSDSQDSFKQPPTKKKSNNPLIKRLIKNIEGAVENSSPTSQRKLDKKAKTSDIKIIKSSDKLIRDSLNQKALFQPIKPENDINIVDHPLKIQNTDGLLDDIDTDIHEDKKVKKSSKETEPMSDFQRKKKLGHRRLNSAPLQKRKNRDVEVQSDLTPEKPFIFLTKDYLSYDDDQYRERSRSLGSRKSPSIIDKTKRLPVNSSNDNHMDFTSMIYEKFINNKGQKSPISKDDPSSKSLKKSFTFESAFSDNVSSSRKQKPDVDATDGLLSRREGSEKMKKIINPFNFFATTFQAVPRPFPASEQYMSQFGGTYSIAINENEPTSLIAFTLSSLEYQTQLEKIQDLMAGKKIDQKSAPGSSQLLSQPNTPNMSRKVVQTLSDASQKISSQSDDSKSVGGITFRAHASPQNPRPNSWMENSTNKSKIKGTEMESLANVDTTLKRVNVGRQHPLSSANEYELNDDEETLENEELMTSGEVPLEESGSTNTFLEEPRKRGSNGTPLIDFHIKLQSSNDVARFYCSVYYAEQFRQLRELIFPEGEERYIQSLARCKFWKATGGKSGSSFSKSLDDRFVMKQMSRPEVQSFVDFAPRYFAYINKAIKEKRPTAFAKLLGVYRIGFKNSLTNTTMRQDVLVMENLFYEKKVSKIYDLKGSVRSRYVHNSAKEDVLMDENLLEMIRESPLFIRPHSKAILSKAIYNDTEFLSTNMVMDYSLLVGVDDVKMELVVGIIDYIRTYTWDKKLENYVKSTGILGGQGKMPTVVSPDLYRTRFTEAMQRYFLMVPDKWTGFGADLN